MNRVIAVVEGQTEQTFVRDVLAPQLAPKGILLTARLVGKPGRKGSVGQYNRARSDILNILRQDSVIYCTTMFDYYGMPHSWPGRSSASTVAYPENALLVEQAIRDDIVQHLGDSFTPARFIPYIQMHEFESLLFSEPTVLAETLQQPALPLQLEGIRKQFDSPEQINDGVETAPSKRLIKLSPTYHKVLHGIIAARRIGLFAMRQQCPHFAEWLAKLEGLAGG